jgi:hypothetical protein
MNDKTNISGELRAAIAVAKQRVEVEPYYMLAMNKGLKGHGSGYWSGTLIGLAIGVGVGALLAVALPVTIPVAAIIGIGGVTGAGLGGVVGSRVGISAFTVAGVMEEKERREKAAELEQEILKSPEKQREALAAYRDDPVVKKDDTLEDLFATHGKKEALAKMVKPKAWAITIIAGALIGAFFFGMPLAGMAGSALKETLAGSFLASLGVETALGAAGAGAVVGAGLGASFGFYMPGALTSLVRKIGGMLSGDMFDSLTHAKGLDKAPELAESAEVASPNLAKLGLAGNLQEAAKNGCPGKNDCPTKNGGGKNGCAGKNGCPSKQRDSAQEQHPARTIRTAMDMQSERLTQATSPNSQLS